MTTYRVRFRVGGIQRQESFEDPVGAQDFCDLVNDFGASAALAILAKRQAKAEASPTLREFTARYLDPDSGILTGVEPGTREGYRRQAELSFLKVLGEIPIDLLERTDVGRWVAWQEKQPSQRRKGQTVAAKTVKNYHALLSSILKAAEEAKLREGNPAYKMRLTKGTKRASVFLSPDEFRTLLHFTSPYYQPLVLLLAGTGLRWGEATALTWADVNLWATPATLRVDKAWKKSTNGAPVLGYPKSSRANRTVSMHQGLVNALGERGEGDRLVFPGRLSGNHIWYGRFLTSVWNPAVERAMNKKLCAESGLTPITRRPTPHDLRHTHASWMIAAGIPLPYIQARLGHESITTTVNTYGHLVPDAHEKMAVAIAQTLDVPDQLAGIEGADAELRAIAAGDLADVTVAEIVDDERADEWDDGEEDDDAEADDMDELVPV